MTTQSRTYNNAHFCYESSNKSCAKHDYSATVRAPLYVVLGAVIILTVFGNLLVIITIAHFKQLHTPTNYLVLSLAVTDFLLGAVIMPPSMVRSLETCWYLGKLFFDRYYAVCQPLRYHSKITNYVTMTMILTCWSLSALLGFGMIFSDLNTWATAEIYTENFLCEGGCTVLQSRMSSTFYSVVFFFLPALLIIVLYLKIIFIARKQSSSIQKRVCANVNLENSKTSLNKTEPKATKTLGIVVGVYLACWGPWFVCNLNDPVIAFSSPVLTEIVMWLGYLNSAINPVIYAFSFTWFRKPFKRTSLSKYLWREMIFWGENWTFDTFIETAVTLDNLAWDLEPWAKPSQEHSGPLQEEPESMQLGPGRLNPVERQLRIQERLCLYYGNPGHFRLFCPAQ
ncbi:trace amine-associated receptor 1-like [Scleropages formosus]|uniref:trace amine-associated receptor 1-like n=1 Tax=Scleropages formosus TaxID=113540 RepID=UPI0010FA698D|nr:trace amine-associated receptor 1-like [Scleropages formosus]